MPDLRKRPPASPAFSFLLGNTLSLAVDELLRQFAYARLLARIFVLEPERWVLKGATGLLARLPSARHSLDVDLWHGSDGDRAGRASGGANR
jgi:hypothetical protein